MDRILAEDVIIDLKKEIFPNDKIDSDDIFIQEGKYYLRQIFSDKSYENLPNVFFVIDIPKRHKIRNDVYGIEYHKKLDKSEDEERLKTDTVISRKDFFLSLKSINFHYADDDHIEQRYNNIFTEPILEEFIIEAKSGNIDNLSARISDEFFGGLSIDKSQIFERILQRRYRIPGLGPEEQFRLYQIAMINSNALELGLEIVDPSLRELDKLKSFETQIRKTTELGVDLGSNVAQVRKEYERKTYSKIIDKLSYIDDKDVLIKGEFNIFDYDQFLEIRGKNSDNKLRTQHYLLVYFHPLSKAYGEEITISIRVPKNEINSKFFPDYEEALNDEQITIPLKILGSVAMNINPKKNRWDLRVTPFVIYV